MALTLMRRPVATRIVCPLTFCPSFSSTTQVSRQRVRLHSLCLKTCKPSHITAAHLDIASRCLSASASNSAAAETSAISSPTTTSATNQQAPENALFRERYIPITRQSIIRYVVQEEDFLTDEEKQLLPEFVNSLDFILVTKYHGVLEELKTLFDPINPDKDTQKSREWTRREKLDNEFWLLQKLEEVMTKANFHELPKKKVESFLRDHEAREKVRVSVDPDRYDILRFWVLGRNVPDLKLSLTERIVNAILRRPRVKSTEYFKRVVVALRLKKDSKLTLKAFKEVPVQSLEMLLPDGKIRMRAFDKGLLASSAAVAGFGALAKVVTLLADLQVDWTLALTLVTGILGLRMWSVYRNRRNAYLVDVSRTLYFKNIANNWGLLTYLVNRAEDESLKEVLLTYIFLLNSATSKKRQGFFSKLQTDGLTKEELESTVAKWLENKTGVNIEFDSEEAVKLLQSLGLLVEQDRKYRVVQLEIAAKMLPESPQSPIARRAMAEAEGFARDEYLETDSDYRSEDVRTQRYGWF